MEKLLTLSQAAERYNQNVPRLEYAAKTGKLVVRQKEKGDIRFVSPEAMEAWLATTPEAIQEQYPDYIWLSDAAKIYKEPDYHQVRYLILGKNNRNKLPYIQVSSSNSWYKYMIEREPFEQYADSQAWTPNEQ